MSPAFAIRAEGLSKRYRIPPREDGPSGPRLRRALTLPFAHLLQSLRAPRDEEVVWALRDASFSVAHGEALGIVGPNGAGKSTLLKVLAQITEPSEGRVLIQGRIGSLLEVGTGFHPELTGRENVLLNGAILGMRRQEINRKFDEIVGFSEVGRFIDTPVKRYSSGMKVRLAFAVAAHLEPEILLIDEVLAVGDAAFQRKCLQRMGSVAREGRTVLFVSHNMTAVRSLCQRAIGLEDGRVVRDASVGEVVDAYLERGSTLRIEKVWDSATAPASRGVRLTHARLRPLSGEGRPITVETALELRFGLHNDQPDKVLNFSVFLYDAEGVCVFNTFSPPIPCPAGGLTGRFVIPGDLLNDSLYNVRTMVVEDGSRCIIDQREILTFEVQDVAREGYWFGTWAGAVRPRFRWRVETEPAAMASGRR